MPVIIPQKLGSEGYNAEFLYISWLYDHFPFFSELVELIPVSVQTQIIMHQKSGLSQGSFHVIAPLPLSFLILEASICSTFIKSRPGAVLISPCPFISVVSSLMCKCAQPFQRVVTRWILIIHISSFLCCRECFNQKSLYPKFCQMLLPVKRLL